MNDYATATSTAFGAGKTNTNTMITKWTNGTYNGTGTQSDYDMWKIVKEKREEVAKANLGMFISSANT